MKIYSASKEESFETHPRTPFTLELTNESRLPALKYQLKQARTEISQYYVLSLNGLEVAGPPVILYGGDCDSPHYFDELTIGESVWTIGGAVGQILLGDLVSVRFGKENRLT